MAVFTLFRWGDESKALSINHLEAILRWPVDKSSMVKLGEIGQPGLRHGVALATPLKGSLQGPLKAPSGVLKGFLMAGGMIN